MTEKLANLREEIAFQYRKHCSSCKGSCCSLELEEGFIAFDMELGKLGKKVILGAANGTGSTMVVPFDNDGRCPLSGNNACSLSLEERPLDCLTYPVYPQVSFHDDGKNELTGLTIRNGCHKVEEISEDRALMELIRTFWERELPTIKSVEMKDWLHVLAR
jgi:Fe-S-cluster containining protein